MILPDLLQPGLRLVICGTAAGTASALRRAYYAGPGNKFWSVLHSAGLTRAVLRPEDFMLLLKEGIGLTDLSKHEHGADADLQRAGFDQHGLIAKIEAIQPLALAFNGKKAASVFFQRPTGKLSYGRQAQAIGQTALYVLPSTSGAASGYWSPRHWHALAEDLSSNGG
jgi:double-stranded uracil-DNA glycosylase